MSSSAFGRLEGGAAHADASVRRRLSPDGGGRRFVLILDEFGIEHFDQLAATLRRRGVRMVRLSGVNARPSRAGLQRLTRWVRDHCLYHARIAAVELSENGSLPARLGEGGVLDVLCDENTLAEAADRRPAVLALAARGLAYGRRPPVGLLDKFEVNAVLQRAGVRVPQQVRTCDIGPAEAVERLGLPLMVKAPIGAAGAGVRVAASLDEVCRAVAELSRGARGPPFYQQYVSGEMVMYAAVNGPGGPLLEHGFRVLANRWPLGPSAVVRLFDDPRLLAAGRLASQALDSLGLAEIGFIRDRDGEVWHVDANLRSWGNMVSLLRAGIDYPRAYLALLDGCAYADPPVAAAAAAQDIAVLPAMLFKAAAQGSWRELSARVGDLMAMCRRGPGLCYGGILLGKTAMLLARRGWRGVVRPSFPDLTATAAPSRASPSPAVVMRAGARRRQGRAER